MYFKMGYFNNPVSSKNTFANLLDTRGSQWIPYGTTLNAGYSSTNENILLVKICQVRRIERSRDRDHPGQHSETPSLLKIQKISWAWWHVPVIPATREAEAGELPEPRRQRLRWAEITPLHSSLGNKMKLRLKKKIKIKNKPIKLILPFL